MSTKVGITSLSDETMKILNSYVDEIADGTDEAADKIAKQCIKDIKSKAPGSGKYKKDWTKKKTSSGRGQVGYTIYNKRPGLPHLLEHGHAKVNGGRVAGRPHIAPAEEKAVQDFQDAVEKLIQNAGG